MWEGKYGRIFFSLFKVAVFLAMGSLIGFLLSLAYASHLYGTPPVVAQIQSWVAGDSLYQVPLSVDESGSNASTNLMMTPISIIPKLGAAYGFAITASMLLGHLGMRALIDAMNVQSKTKSKSGSRSKSLQIDPGSNSESGSNSDSESN